MSLMETDTNKENHEDWTKAVAFKVSNVHLTLVFCGNAEATVQCFIILWNQDFDESISKSSLHVHWRFSHQVKWQEKYSMTGLRKFFPQILIVFAEGRTYYKALVLVDSSWTICYVSSILMRRWRLCSSLPASHYCQWTGDYFPRLSSCAWSRPLMHWSVMCTILTLEYTPWIMEVLHCHGCQCCYSDCMNGYNWILYECCLLLLLLLHPNKITFCLFSVQW